MERLCLTVSWQCEGMNIRSPTWVPVMISASKTRCPSSLTMSLVPLHKPADTFRLRNSMIGVPFFNTNRWCAMLPILSEFKNLTGHRISKPSYSKTTWTNYYDGPIRNFHIYDTLFCSRCTGLLYLLPATASCTIVLLQTNFLSQTDTFWLFFIQRILLCRITYWTPLEMLPPTELVLHRVKCKVLKCFGIVLSQSDTLKSEFENLPISSLKVSN
jgi:hypothetical protein